MGSNGREYILLKEISNAFGRNFGGYDMPVVDRPTIDIYHFGDYRERVFIVQFFFLMMNNDILMLLLEFSYPYLIKNLKINIYRTLNFTVHKDVGKCVQREKSKRLETNLPA